MCDYAPQDEWFEWEDIIVARQANHTAQVKEFPCPRSISTQQVPINTATRDQNGMRRMTPFELPFVSAPRPKRISLLSSALLDLDDSASDFDFPSYDDQPEIVRSEPKPSRTRDQLSKDDLHLNARSFVYANSVSRNWTLDEISASCRILRTERGLKKTERSKNGAWRIWSKTLYNLSTALAEDVEWEREYRFSSPVIPFQVKAIKVQAVPGCSPDRSRSSILKRSAPPDSDVSCSQLSVPDARRHSTGNMSNSTAKRAVRFNDFVEECSLSPNTINSISSRRSSAPVISSAPLKTGEEKSTASMAPIFLMQPISVQPQTSNVYVPSSNSHWTFLGDDEDEEEVDWISPLPTQSTVVRNPSACELPSLVHDIHAKSSYGSDSRIKAFASRAILFEEDDDDFAAQYMFDCEFRSDTESLPPSDTDSSTDDNDEEGIDFLDGSEFGNNSIVMERLHELSSS